MTSAPTCFNERRMVAGLPAASTKSSEIESPSSATPQHRSPSRAPPKFHHHNISIQRVASSLLFAQPGVSARDTQCDIMGLRGPVLEGARPNGQWSKILRPRKFWRSARAPPRASLTLRSAQPRQLSRPGRRPRQHRLQMAPAASDAQIAGLRSQRSSMMLSLARCAAIVSTNARMQRGQRCNDRRKTHGRKCL